jgi:hypothetical protein
MSGPLAPKASDFFSDWIGEMTNLVISIGNGLVREDDQSGDGKCKCYGWL